MKPIDDGCADDEFTCDSGQCIRGNYKCDGRRDCVRILLLFITKKYIVYIPFYSLRFQDDASDESLRVCYQGEILCVDSRQNFFYIRSFDLKKKKML